MKKIMVFGLAVALLGGVAGCSDTSDTANNSSSTSQTISQTKQTQASSKGQISFKVTVEEAIKTYQETYPDSDITSIELETSFGKYSYKIEGVDDEREYEVQVNADTKEVSKDSAENLDSEDKAGVKRNADKLDLENLLSVERAAEIAAKKAGGGKAEEWQLDKELGTTYWEVKVVNGHKETDVKLDAKSGEVLETEIDD
ncbi:PepSY domain-containing protein [Enterococcus pseudoavium]|uniref:PepSY domain-containing protein n=1 Tax=Enterococcus pseudoavium TaxID=44007 RepID=UPI003F9581C4